MGDSTLNAFFIIGVIGAVIGLVGAFVVDRIVTWVM